mmetsp:Transcript_10201/g.32307  ORF Transcript_10201/g.32307 Transcript_10201/m.32307 type:complete len:202 (+) Transcript_10201:610-1215(+)
MASCTGWTCVARCSARATAPRRRAWAASHAPARRWLTCTPASATSPSRTSSMPARRTCTLASGTRMLSPPSRATSRRTASRGGARYMRATTCRRPPRWPAWPTESTSASSPAPRRAGLWRWRCCCRRAARSTCTPASARARARRTRGVGRFSRGSSISRRGWGGEAGRRGSSTSSESSRTHRASTMSSRTCGSRRRSSVNL